MNNNYEESPKNTYAESEAKEITSSHCMLTELQVFSNSAIPQCRFKKLA